jgi:predicted GH43/DUF377 family glycosyl hydrolase
MWYTGSNATSASHIGYATSQDGVIWQKHLENPVMSPGLLGDWQEDEVREPHVMLNEGIYQMWYGSGNQIGYATSVDGIDWEKHSGNPVLVPWGFGSYAVEHPTVIRLFDEFYMWYESRELSRAGYENYIQDATSPNGINWSEHSYTFITCGSPFDRQPAVILRPTSAQMWFVRGWVILFAEADLDFSSLDKTVFLPVIMR